MPKIKKPKKTRYFNRKERFLSKKLKRLWTLLNQAQIKSVEFQWEKCHHLCQSFIILLLLKTNHSFNSSSTSSSNRKTQPEKILYFLLASLDFRTVNYFMIRALIRMLYKITSMWKELKNSEKNIEIFNTTKYIFYRLNSV
jgi:hypothetical protein